MSHTDYTDYTENVLLSLALAVRMAAARTPFDAAIVFAFCGVCVRK